VGKIRILDPQVASRIAAGEVVERPASVVKELVENSLDAGAQAIRVEIRKGGVEEIRVEDDGEGIHPEDLPRCLLRHATSKIRSFEDLASLATLGFRGEALPSIASVSRLVLESCASGSGEGARVRSDGGATGGIEVAAHPRGTTVVVRGLFSRTPARRKFLRSEGTETEAVSDALCRLALAHFDRGFTLQSDGRTLLDAPPAPERGERVRQIFGAAVAERLVPFARAEGILRASGFASLPDFHRSNSRDVRLFVNGRAVRDRSLLHAVTGAYHTLLPRGRHPFVILFLEIPPGRVDVNVHPAKTEVRMADPRAAYEAVLRAIRSALDRARPVAAYPVPGADPGPPRDPAPPRSGREDPGRGDWRVAEPEGGGTEEGLFPAEAPGGGGTLVPLAQYRESYILASDPEGLVIVDQHAAHERILYERLLAEASEARVRRQALLFPVPVELDPGRARRLEERREELERIGFRTEPFGGRSLLVREVPALIESADVGALLRDLADEIPDPGAGETSLERIRDRLAATTACHAAVKVNFPLTREKMVYLLEGLSRTATPMTCPHGRPIQLRFPQRDLEKGFRRR
jgi:DNA mismatch repair protein MutL